MRDIRDQLSIRVPHMHGDKPNSRQALKSLIACSPYAWG
ncbi:conserved protein of unknown function [Xenorhabdus poinarii G6]|uniref:Uncharacterized protein n=1 Tax=Xenorhabdus poinarii G6 TaxID=1354304 RepID=A0A068R0I1_9GAMM|nr:conserved protein of unknown function [Xenorhabdus poinarii G6]